MFSRVIRTIQLGLKSLLLHKLRSGLTMLGIVFGVFSVIAMLAIGEGASKQAQKQIVALGARNIIVRSVKPVEGSSNDQSGGGTPRYGLLRSDLRRLQKTIPEVVSAIPIRELNREARYRKFTMQSRLVGCTPEYQELNQLRLSKGRFISDTDRASRANVVVLAHEVAAKLFPIEDPLENRAIQVGDIFYSVIGVTEPRNASAAIGGSLSGQEFNKDLYIPIETFRARIGDQVYTPKQGGMDSEHVELNQITLEVRDVQDVIRTSEVVRGTLEKFHPQKDFAVVVPLELLKQAEQLRQIFNVVLGSIAAISLVVGGIGIMNIMLATVTERHSPGAGCPAAGHHRTVPYRDRRAVWNGGDAGYCARIVDPLRVPDDPQFRVEFRSGSEDSLRHVQDVSGDAARGGPLEPAARVWNLGGNWHPVRPLSRPGGGQTRSD